MGPVQPASSDNTPVGSNNGAAMNMDGGDGRWQHQSTPQGENTHQSAHLAPGQFVVGVVHQAAANVEAPLPSNAGNNAVLTDRWQLLNPILPSNCQIMFGLQQLLHQGSNQ
jgi:hypothetical protein